MRKSISFMPCSILFLLLPVAASAHNGHVHGFGQGFVHPFAGIDHLLAMLAVGWWSASSLPGRWWLVPSAFAATVLAGALFAMTAAVPLAAVEFLIAVSLLMLGILLFARTRLSLVAATMMVAAMGVAHGMAHGRELPMDAAVLSWLGGMVLATLVLHLIGAAIGRMARQRGPWMTRTGGAVIAATGVVLAVALALS